MPSLRPYQYGQQSSTAPLPLCASSNQQVQPGPSPVHHACQESHGSSSSVSSYSIFQICMLVIRCCILAGVPVIAALAALTLFVTLAMFWRQIVQEKRHRQSRCLGSQSGTLSCTCRPGSQQMRQTRSACGWMAGHMSSCRCELCQCICTPATYALIAASF